jgi:hypothetical protein
MNDVNTHRELSMRISLPSRDERIFASGMSLLRDHIKKTTEYMALASADEGWVIWFASSHKHEDNGVIMVGLLNYNVGIFVSNN